MRWLTLQAGSHAWQKPSLLRSCPSFPRVHVRNRRNTPVAIASSLGDVSDVGKGVAGVVVDFGFATADSFEVGCGEAEVS